MQGSSTPGGNLNNSDVKFSSETTHEISREEDCEDNEDTKILIPSVEEEENGSSESEGKYYHIDKLVNQLIRLRLEINQTLAERSEMLTELEKVKERLSFLNRPASSNLLVIEAFLKDTQDKYRSILSRVKAKDEFLSLLMRQYDDTSILASQEKSNFLGLSPDKPSLTPPPLVESKPLTMSTFQPESLKSRDTWTTVSAGVSLEIEHPERTETINDWKKNFSYLPKKITEQCTKKKCGICNKKFKDIEEAILHYKSDQHLKNVEICLKKYSGNSKFLFVPQKLLTPSRERKLDDKEAEMRQIAEIFSDEISRKNVQEKCPWVDSHVVDFVLTSIEDFKTLLKWLEDLESEEIWNQKDINDVLYGLGIVYRTLILLTFQLSLVSLNFNI